MGKIVGTGKKITDLFVLDQQYAKYLEDAFTNKSITVLTICYQSIKQGCKKIKYSGWTDRNVLKMEKAS